MVTHSCQNIPGVKAARTGGPDCRMLRIQGDWRAMCRSSGRAGTPPAEKHYESSHRSLLCRLATQCHFTTTIVPGFTLENTVGTVPLGPRMQACEAG